MTLLLVIQKPVGYYEASHIMNSHQNYYKTPTHTHDRYGLRYHYCLVHKRHQVVVMCYYHDSLFLRCFVEKQ